ncbi:MAG: imelysin family protein [Burkholderiales bacterium]|jgi:predicted lipoprotein|nr:imelysin family protein [Burkholderiales bacterium]
MSKRTFPPAAAALAALALVLPWQASAQAVAANEALPFYDTAAFMKGVHQQWYAPRSRDFAAAAAALSQDTRQFCNGAPPGDVGVMRQGWQRTTLAWERLAAVAIGPLVQRRSMRQIDFTPTRPELIQRAIRAQPADARAMERVGTPAKGLPALEWMLWSQPIAPATPACRYAIQVAAEIDAEARALAQGFADLAALDWSDESEPGVPAMVEFVNQWVGGLERLRWANLEKPLRSAGNKPPAFGRQASGLTAQAWAAEWEGVGGLATFRASGVPQPGVDLVPVETYLRGRGLNPLADKLRAAVGQVDTAFQGLVPGDAAKVNAAGRALAGVKRLVEGEIAPALEVNIGFSDADGD